MLVTYKGASNTLNVDVNGKVYRLVPNKPTEIDSKQADILKKRMFIKLLIEAGDIEFSEPPKADKKADSNKPKLKK